MGAERLQKVLASAGVASRRDCEELIAAGRVSVNGRVVHELGTRVDLVHDLVTVDGKPVQPPGERTYILLHKPVGVVSTVDDPQGRPTVVDLVDVPTRIFPVGRLDVDSEGLLILTDDGELTHHLTHPSFAVEKEYRALLDRAPTASALRDWRAGVMLEGERTAPAWVEVLDRSDEGTWVRVVLREGRKRQIREIARLLGYTVKRLIRVREGSLLLGDLPAGSWRVLQPEEVQELRTHVPPASRDQPVEEETVPASGKPAPRRSLRSNAGSEPETGAERTPNRRTGTRSYANSREESAAYEQDDFAERERGGERERFATEQGGRSRRNGPGGGYRRYDDPPADWDETPPSESRSRAASDRQRDTSGGSFGRDYQGQSSRSYGRFNRDRRDDRPNWSNDRRDDRSNSSNDRRDDRPNWSNDRRRDDRPNWSNDRRDDRSNSSNDRRDDRPHWSNDRRRDDRPNWSNDRRRDDRPNWSNDRRDDRPNWSNDRRRDDRPNWSNDRRDDRSNSSNDRRDDRSNWSNDRRRDDRPNWSNDRRDDRRRDDRPGWNDNRSGANRYNDRNQRGTGWRNDTANSGQGQGSTRRDEEQRSERERPNWRDDAPPRDAGQERGRTAYSSQPEEKPSPGRAWRERQNEEARARQIRSGTMRMSRSGRAPFRSRTEGRPNFTIRPRHPRNDEDENEK